MPNDLGTSIFERALNETMDLLAAARFNTRFGSYQQGELSAVTVMVSPASEGDATRVQVICHDPGHLGIDWDGIPLFLIDHTTGDERPGFLDARGRAGFNVRISSENDLGLLAVPVRHLAKVEVPKEMIKAQFAQHAPQGKVSAFSPDGAVSADAEVVGEGLLRITIKALIPEMRNAEVRVILRSKADPSEVWLSRKIKLNRNDGERGSWSRKIGEEELRNRRSAATLLVFPVKRN